MPHCACACLALAYFQQSQKWMCVVRAFDWCSRLVPSSADPDPRLANTSMAQPAEHSDCCADGTVPPRMYSRFVTAHVARRASSTRGKACRVQPPTPSLAPALHAIRRLTATPYPYGHILYDNTHGPAHGSGGQMPMSHGGFVNPRVGCLSVRVMAIHCHRAPYVSVWRGSRRSKHAAPRQHFQCCRINQ